MGRPAAHNSIMTEFDSPAAYQDRTAIGAKYGRGKLVGQEPQRIVVGMMKEEFDPAAASSIITLAAAMMAAIAATGNNDSDTLFKVLSAAMNNIRRLPAVEHQKLAVIADELVEAAKTNKDFVALARFATGP